MFRLLLFCLILQTAICMCPSKLQLTRDGQCRGYYAHGTPYMDTAINDVTTSCKAINAFPYSIHNDEQLSWWSSMQDEGWFNVMGLQCNTGSKLWEWADGTTLDFKPPSGKYDSILLYKSCSKPFFLELDEDCKVCSWILSQDSYWSINCTHAGHGVDYFCIAQLEQPIASTDCGSFNDDSDDSVCYEIAKQTENWKDAQTICHSFGAEVASVHSDQENSYIRRLAVSRGAINGVLLGGTISGKGNDFGWVDGSDWDYTNFHFGFPIDGLGDCLSMDTVTTAGQWMNTDCDAKMPVACSRPLHDTPEQTGCSPGPWKEGQIIYSPGFPNDASLPCEYFLSVEAGRKVKLELLMLEANSCCDYLVLTDGYIGGTVMANLTGEISDKTYYTSNTNILRAVWQPNGGVNVRGLMMTFSTY